jgi:hypothetical protein
MADGINAIGNLPGKVDSNNQLVVALGSGSTLPNDIDVDAGTGTARAGVGGVLTVSTTSAQTGANTTETDLWTYSLPANTLSTDNYGVRISVTFTAAANANLKNFRLYFGATVVNDALGVSVGGGAGGTVLLHATVLRRTATTETAAGFRGIATSVNAYPASTPAENTANAITIKATGQNGTASAGDIVFQSALVEFLRPGS